MTARAVLAAADTVAARIADAEKAVAALEEIKRLHTPMEVCAGCGQVDCHPCCTTSVEECLSICRSCCRDERYAMAANECWRSHEHTADGPACATAEIIARAGL